MNLPPLPPLQEPNMHAHELLSNDGGVWLGCKDKSVVERAHDPGETGEEVRALFTAEQMQAYAEQYGRLCAEAERDRLQASVAELEVDAERHRWLRANYFHIEAPGINLHGVRDFGDEAEASALDKEIDDIRAAIDTARKAKP